MAWHGLNDFISQVKKDDFARANRYEVIFHPPDIMQNHHTSQGESVKIISMMAEEVLFPGVILGTRALRLNNLNQQRATMIDFGGDSISFSFLIDTSWTVKDFFGDWMRKIVNPVTRYLEYPDSYYANIDIYALNNKDEVVVHWEIEDAFPRSIAPVSASATNAQALRLPVTFAYKKWKVDGAYNPEGNDMQYMPEGQPDQTQQEADNQIADVERQIAQDQSEDDTVLNG